MTDNFDDLDTADFESLQIDSAGPALKRAMTSGGDVKHRLRNQDAASMLERTEWKKAMNQTQEQREAHLREKILYEELVFNRDETKSKKSSVVVDMDAWKKKKQVMVQKANQDHFSNNMDLNWRAAEAEKKLDKIRQEMLKKDNVCMTGDFYSKLDFLKESPLYEALDIMPKPAVHHIHLTAACPIKFLVEKMLYYDFVYFNEKDQMFKVTKKGLE